MTTTKRLSFKKFMTAEGTAVFPKLNAPDTKFKDTGEYGVKLRLSVEDSEALIADIEKQLKDYWPIAKAEYEEKLANAKTGADKAKAKKALEGMKEADKSYKPAYDDDGNETGEYEFNIKMPAQFVRKKDGKVIKMAPDIFDAAGKKLANAPEIWGGSRLIVAGEFRPFSMPIGVGISLRLSAVQIIELSSGGGARDAGAYGFGKQDGYEGSEDDDGPGFRSQGADTSEPEGAEEEF